MMIEWIHNRQFEHFEEKAVAEIINSMSDPNRTKYTKWNHTEKLNPFEKDENEKFIEKHSNEKTMILPDIHIWTI